MIETLNSNSFYFLFCPVANECRDKTCGLPCSEGICDGNGRCASPEENPCMVHGCEGKECGESCLSGDTMGACDASGKCSLNGVLCPGNHYLKWFNFKIEWLKRIKIFV